MGYEILYKYFDSNGEGDYDKKESKELKKKVGEPFEDVPLEKLASVIMSQLARRDIWIHDVQIFELAKKEISFKGTKGGIVIKHKKFLLDSDSSIIIQEVKEDQPLVTVPSVPAVAPNVNLAPAVQNTRPIKWVTLDPSEPNLAKVKGSGLAFLPDKRYPVLQETPHPKEFGVSIYRMIDENKREVTIKDMYFTNADQILQRGFRSAVDKDVSQRLTYGEKEEAEMPDIRSRR